MVDLTGSFETSHAQKYLRQLCKHFAHKVSVNLNDHVGDVVFPFGNGRFKANENQLVVEFMALPEDRIDRAKYVIDEHLKTFAFRESFESMDWDILS